jgi:hypothetical protein
VDQAVPQSGPDGDVTGVFGLAKIQRTLVQHAPLISADLWWHDREDHALATVIPKAEICNSVVGCLVEAQVWAAEARERYASGVKNGYCRGDTRSLLLEAELGMVVVNQSMDGELSSSLHEVSDQHRVASQDAGRDGKRGAGVESIEQRHKAPEPTLHWRLGQPETQHY